MFAKNVAVFPPNGWVSVQAVKVGIVLLKKLSLMKVAKGQGRTVFVVGHVTKSGNIAGPKVLEHMVDTVLYLEGDKDYFYRLIRSGKNRFGSTDEIGVFEMSKERLREVLNPSQYFLSEGTAHLFQVQLLYQY